MEYCEFSTYVPESRRNELKAVLNTVAGLLPTSDQHTLKDSTGDLYSASKDANVWVVTTINKRFRDGFLLNTPERGLMENNKKIATIKSLRERFNMNLMDAKDHIELFVKYYDINPGHPCFHEKHWAHRVDETSKLCLCCGRYI